MLDTFRTIQVIVTVTVALIAIMLATPETFGQSHSPRLPFPGAESIPNNPPRLPQRPANQQLPATGGTWQLSAKPAPVGGLNNPLLLTDGTVIVQKVDTSIWYKLTPDVFGNYVNGTWSQIASLPSGYGPDAYASAVLPDGRVIVEGGEYNVNFGPGQEVWTSLGAIYDPVVDVWTPVSPPTGSGWINTTGQPGQCNGGIGDAPSIVLPNGTFLLGAACAHPPVDALFDATNLTWSSTGSPIGPAGKRSQDEAGYTLLQTDKVLMIDIGNPPNAQIYNPGTGTAGGTWTSIAPAPVALPDTCGTAEIGPAVARPDGTVVAFGGNTCTASPADPTAIYNPFNDTWTQGPNVPATCGTNGTTSCTLADAGAVMLPNGNVLFAASSGFNQTPTHWFEFTNTNTINQVADDFFASNSFSGTFNLLVLPNGQILVTAFSHYVEFYTPTGTYQSSWQPVITSVATNLSAGSSYVIAGSQLNGLSQGGAYGDDDQSATNYPLVRITNNDTNHVFYARTFNHSTMSIAPNTAALTNFTVPTNAENGTSTLVVVANGIPSQPVAVTISNGVAPPEPLTVNVTGSGTVTSNDGAISCPSTCSTNYINGTQVDLTATPASGYVFTGWSGACSGTGACSVTMSAPRAVSATFVQLFALSVSGIGSGTVTSTPLGIDCGSTCSANFTSGTLVALNETPAAGWTFSGWSGACSGSGTCNVTMSAAQSVTATFAQASYTLSVGVSGSGTVTSSPSGISCNPTCSANFLSGTPVTLTATPASGATFNGWSGACTGSGGCSVTMNAAASVSASFTIAPPPPVARTFVSAAGSDSNNCANVATPCRHLAAAYAATAANGEIYVLDPANYGAVTITHGVSIEGHGWASIAPVAGQAAITINANTGDKINIIGVVLDGTALASTTGIRYNSGGSLNIRDSVIRNFTQDGIAFASTSSSPSQLSVSNVLVSDNTANGINIGPSGSGTVTGVLDHVDMENNGANGLVASTASPTINVTLSDSLSANNGAGIGASSVSAAPVNIMVRNCTIANNASDGLVATGTGATIRVTQSTISGNVTGWLNSSGGVVTSYADNNIDGNTSVNTEPPLPLTYK